MKQLSREQKCRVRELRLLVRSIHPKMREELLSRQHVELVQVQRDRAMFPKYAGGNIGSPQKARKIISVGAT